MGSMNDHCLDAEKLKKGVRLPLFKPDGGISDDYIMVRWAWDDKVRAVMDDMERDLTQKVMAASPTLEMNAKQKRAAEKKVKELSAESVLETQCSLVLGWSFSENCTKANVRKLLKSRPDIANRIDVASAKTNLFFPNSGKSS